MLERFVDFRLDVIDLCDDRLELRSREILLDRLHERILVVPFELDQVSQMKPEHAVTSQGSAGGDEIAGGLTAAGNQAV